MMPLILRIKKNAHKEIAGAQDILVEETYKIFDKAVMHGGTAIWRCYKGNRFSEDIDLYIPEDKDRIETLFENFKKRGFTVEKKKIGENSLFSKLQIGKTVVRFESLFKKQNGVLKEYETVEGNLITVYTLLPEELIKEKVDAYSKRYEIRDLYDIFFLLRHVTDKGKVVPMLELLFTKFKEPEDEKELKVLILEGITPDVKGMIKYIKRFT